MTILRADSIERFCRAADICAILGARYLFLTSGRGYETEAPESAWDRAVDSLARIAEHARRSGVRCLLEPLQRVETNILLDAKGLRRMLDDIGADNIDVVLDTVAMATAGDTVADYFLSSAPTGSCADRDAGRPSGMGDGTLPLGRYVSRRPRRLPGRSRSSRLATDPMRSIRSRRGSAISPPSSRISTAHR